MDEKPVAMKKVKVEKAKEQQSADETGMVCVVHFARNRPNADCNIRPLTLTSFATIQNAVCVRQMQDNASQRLDSICSSVPADFNEQVHGVHRWCYKYFTNVSKLKKRKAVTEFAEKSDCCETGHTRKSTRASTSVPPSSVLFPLDRCIFCDTGRKRIRKVMEGLVKCVTECAEQTIKECAVEKNDFTLLGKIEGIDLRAREAHYHESCRRDYVRRDGRGHKGLGDVTDDGTSWFGGREQRAAYDDAFRNLCVHIRSNIIQGGSVERMSMLRERYLQYIQEHAPDFYNPNHMTQKLKDKLCKHFGNEIQFWQPNYRSELVFSSGLHTGEAVEAAFEAATSERKILEDAAAILRRHINYAHSTSPEMPWPPPASYLHSETISPPASLKDFLALLFSGKTTAQCSDKTATLTASVAEDICSATTRGRWKMPKHLLLGMTLHHLTRSAELITIMNRYGHCQSYSSVLELETAMGNQVKQQDSVLPANISPNGNKVCHVCWDNFDINEETPSGAGTTHSTHGIVIQEVIDNHQAAVTVDSVPRTKETSLKYTPTTLQPCFSKKRVEPSGILSPPTTQEDVVSVILNESTGTSVYPSSTSLLAESLWIICKGLFNKQYTVPDWIGWVSKTADVDPNHLQSTIGYMAPILNPITDYATVQQCIITSMQVSKQLRQEYTFVTMDLAAAKIAYDIVWDGADRFAKVIVHLGAFHIMCSYMGALGKMMIGSGFEDVIIEAGVCASGSIDKVMSGKHYNRAMRVHQHMLVALERLLLNEFLASSSTDSDDVSIPELKAISELADCPDIDKLLAAECDDDCTRFVAQYNMYKNDVRCGKYGQTAQFWLSYCDCVWILLRFQQAVKENNLELYTYSLRQLCILLFSSDHINYARYLPLYYTQLKHLPSSHPGAELLLRDCGFTVSRSDVPACRNAIDLTIEQTINRSAKTRGGLIGISRNVSAYYRWCLTRHTRATYVDATLERVNMLSNSNDAHKSTRPSEVRRSEANVLSIVAAFKQFLNPFAIETNRQHLLFCLSSGQPAPDTVAQDLLQYMEVGDKAAQTFIEARLLNKTVKFQEPMKKQKLQTFQSMATKHTLTSTQKKTIQIKAERDLLGRLLLLSQANDISLEKLFQYPLGPIPWSLATADGGLVKTDKSQLMHYLEATIPASDSPAIDNCASVVDGNAQFQAIAHLPQTFADLAYDIFSSLPKAKIVHFVTDTYREQTIKQLERNRRGSSTPYLISGPKTKLPRDFKTFLLNSSNKRQFICFLLREWQTERYAQHLQGRQVFFVCEEECLCLESHNGRTVSVSAVQELFSSQEEADTRIILHCLYAAERIADDVTISVRSPDTDVFVILLAYSTQIRQALFFDTGTGNNRRQLDIHKIADAVGHDMVKALPAFHAFTGSDCTSAFVRKGKRNPMKMLEKHADFILVFQKLGTGTDVSEDILSELQRFVCCMYGKAAYSDTNKVRYDVF
jgi:hypothetical protein